MSAANTEYDSAGVQPVSTLSHRGRHLADVELFIRTPGIEADARRVGDKDHLIARPAERLDAHFTRLTIERKSPEIQVRSKSSRDGQLISGRPVGSYVERPIGDIGGSGIDKLELRPPHCLQLLDGGLLKKALRLCPSKGESWIVPAECQIEVALKGLAALGSSRQIREEKPCSQVSSAVTAQGRDRKIAAQ